MGHMALAGTHTWPRHMTMFVFYFYFIFLLFFVCFISAPFSYSRFLPSLQVFFSLILYGKVGWTATKMGRRRWWPSVGDKWVSASAEEQQNASPRGWRCGCASRMCRICTHAHHLSICSPERSSVFLPMSAAPAAASSSYSSLSVCVHVTFL